MLQWFRQIDNATRASEVVAIAREYFATWGPRELARLPPGCRPGRVRDEEDINALHACLVDEYRLSKATGDELVRLQEITSFVVRAAIRLSELAADGDDLKPGGSGDPGDGPARSAAAPDS